MEWVGVVTGVLAFGLSAWNYRQAWVRDNSAHIMVTLHGSGTPRPRLEIRNIGRGTARNLEFMGLGAGDLQLDTLASGESFFTPPASAWAERELSQPIQIMVSWRDRGSPKVRFTRMSVA